MFGNSKISFYGFGCVIRYGILSKSRNSFKKVPLFNAKQVSLVDTAMKSNIGIRKSTILPSPNSNLFYSVYFIALL